MGERIRFEDGRWIVSDRPVIPFIEGDGTGPDIWRAARRVFDAAVAKTAGGRRRLEGVENFGGGEGVPQTGSWRPPPAPPAVPPHPGAPQSPPPTPAGGGGPP